MNLLTRYILRQFLKNIMTIMLCLIAIYLLIDFFEKIDNFQEQGKSMGLVLEFFLLNIPFILDRMSPVCILLAGVVTLGILNNSNELIALKAAGVPLKKITTPIIAAGGCFVLLFLALSQFVLPVTIGATNKIWNEEVLGKVVLGIYRNGRYYYRGTEGFYSFSRPSLADNEFLGFSYSTWNDKNQLSTLIAADKALFREGQWLLTEGQRQDNIGNERYDTSVFAEKTFSLPERPEDFFIPEHRAMELSLTELFRETGRQQSSEEQHKAWADFYDRLSYTLLGLPLLLLGLPLLLMVYRRWGQDLTLAIPVSCGLAFACWGIWGILQSLARAVYLNSLIAALSVHLMVSAAGLFLLYKEDA